MKSETTFSLKDQLFNDEKVDYLTNLLTAAYPEFKAAAFRSKLLDPFPDLALKECIYHIAACLREFLPADYPTAVEILLAAQPPPLDPTKTDDDFGDFILAPYSHFVAAYGCTAHNLDLSLDALRQMTQRFSAEGPIRDFISAFPEQTLDFLMGCAADDNYHVRRLASEGSRPLLPWAPRLSIDYHRPVPILDRLFADPTRYVTRSVANHLNDIAKLDPPLVVETLQRWQAAEKQNENEMAYIVRHATRTLIKQGDPAALALLGFGQEPDIAIRELTCETPEVTIGDALIFSFQIKAHSSQKLLVDYVIDFAGAGRQGGRKVFKLKQLKLKAGETAAIRKRHPLRPMTTRSLYPGTHRVTLQINGQPHEGFDFRLQTTDIRPQ